MDETVKNLPGESWVTTRSKAVGLETVAIKRLVTAVLEAT
jgi:hypothetical protein